MQGTAFRYSISTGDAPPASTSVPCGTLAPLPDRQGPAEHHPGDWGQREWLYLDLPDLPAVQHPVPT